MSVMHLKWRALLVCLLFISLTSAQAAVRLPDGEFSDTVTDLNVKVMGGTTSQKHTWYKNSLYVNRQWASLVLTYDNLDGTLTSIERNGDRYTKSNEQGTLFKFGKRHTISVTETGLRWQDRQGNWISYTSTGVISAYGDRNLTKATLEHNAAGQLMRVRDLFNRTVLTYTYLGHGPLSAVEDVAGHRVEYTTGSSPGGSTSSVTDVLGNTRSYRYSLTYTTAVTCLYPAAPVVIGPPFPGDPDYIAPPPRSGDCIPYTYQSPLEDLTITDPAGRIVSVPSQDGLTTRVANQDTASTSYTYSFDKLKKQYSLTATTSSGRTEDATYNADGLLISQTVNGQRLQTVSLDGNSRTYTDRNGGLTVDQYDEFDNLIKRTYPDGATLSYAYDTYSSITRQVDENGVVITNDYDAKGNLIRSTEAVGLPEQRSTEYSYDQYGNRLQIKRLGDANTTEAITSFTYDDAGNISSETDPEGHVTRYTYDSQGNTLTRTDPRSKLSVNTYDAAGRLLTETNPLGHVTRYAYDKVGNKLSATDHKSKITRFDYDARDNLITLTDPAGQTRRTAYNHNSQITQTSDEDGKTVNFAYDITGRLNKITDGNDNLTTQSFADAGLPGSGLLNQASSIQYPTYQQQFKYDRRNRTILNTVLLGTEGLVTRYEYDAKGNIVAETDRNGKTTYYRFDAFQQITRITDALGQVTESAYDNRGNLISLKDAKGNITRLEYDKNNRLLKQSTPLGHSSTYAYDPNGNLIQKTDAKGQQTQYAYDAANQQTTVSYFAANSVTPSQTVTFTYDANDNLSTWNDGEISATLSYDDRNRKTGESIDYGPFSLSYSYTYYPNGNKQSFTGPDGITYDYSFDAANQFSSINLPGQGAITTNAYEWIAPTKITLPGGTTRELSYNGLLSIEAIQVKTPAQTVISELHYSYGKLQNVIQKTSANDTASYTYDDLTRLTQTTSTQQAQEDFTLDAVGNRTAASDGGAWNYNEDNQITARANITYSYDANGNLTQKSTSGTTDHFRYDPANRLIQVDDGNSLIKARYGYDPFDLRLWKDIQGVKTYYMYADEGLIGEFNASGAQLSSYGWQPASQWTTNPLFLKNADGYHFYQNDHLGTPQQLTSASGAIEWSASYQAFGQAQIGTAAVTNNLRLPGQYLDSETGLHYNWRRYFDPETGRYLTPDPLGLEGGGNLYAYVEADPINNIDPSGECGLLGVAIGGILSIGIDLITGDCIDFDGLLIGAGVDAATCGLGKLAKLRKLRKLLPCSINSFTGDTLVNTREGLKPIEDIKIGDQVLSHAEWSGEDSYQPVEAVITGEQDYNLVRITLTSGETIEATSGHPLFVQQHGWRDADHLKVGDKLYLQDQGSVKIKAIEREERHETVYNLTVANTHTYYVGEDGVLVHNAGCSNFFAKAKPFRGKTKTNGKSGKDREYYEKDYTHGDIEVYDSRGNHKGSADPTTGEMTKPPVPGRKIDI